LFPYVAIVEAATTPSYVAQIAIEILLFVVSNSYMGYKNMKLVNAQIKASTEVFTRIGNNGAKAKFLCLFPNGGDVLDEWRYYRAKPMNWTQALAKVAAGR
jgi:hypothetical protein